MLRMLSHREDATGSGQQLPSSCLPAVVLVPVPVLISYIMADCHAGQNTVHPHAA